MSLAEGLRDVLDDAAAALPADTADMAARAAAILRARLAAGDDGLAADGALGLVDHLFRGSAAAGALRSLTGLTAPEAPPAPPARRTPPARTPPEGDGQ